MAVGEADVDALLDRIPSHLLSEWMAYYSIEPFGEARADFRNATLLSFLADALGLKKNGQHFKPIDFMPDFESEPIEQPHQTWQQQKAMFRAALGKK